MRGSPYREHQRGRDAPVTIFVLAAFALSTECSRPDDKKSSELIPKIEPVTTSLLVSALLPVAINALSGLWGFLTKPSDFQDTIIFGRSMRIKMCGETCAQITDRASGLTEVGMGDTVQGAIGDATKKLFDELLTKDLISLHDLCDLHITFPHPDQNTCPGFQINPCDLIHPVATTPVPCHNQHGDVYCERYKSRCDIPNYHSFMRQYCLKTCSAGTCSFDDTPKNPCLP